LSYSIKSTPVLQSDEKTLSEYSTDFGNLLTRKPSVVASPHTPSSLREYLQYAHSRGIKLTFRGGGQSFYGQSLCDGGMVIDIKALWPGDSFPETGDGWVMAPAAMLLYDLQVFLRQKGLRLPIYTSATRATLGGTLAAGGISGRSFSRGLLADHVLEIDLMTSDAQLLTCSPETNSDIFSYSLGTMGLSGAILKAKIRTELLLPYRVQMVSKNIPIASLFPMSEELRSIPEVVSMEGFINLGSRQITADVYSTIEAENEGGIKEKVQAWQEIAKRLDISSYSIRVVHIDDALGFSASLAGWKPTLQRNLKMNLINKKLSFYSAPVPVAFDRLEAISFIERFVNYTGHHSLFFVRRPYFAVISSMKQPEPCWLRLSKRDSHVMGFDLFVTFPHFKKNRGEQILNEIAHMAAEHSGRIYPYGFLPERELLSRLLPNISEKMMYVVEKTDPEHLIKPVLLEVGGLRKKRVSDERKRMSERRFRAFNVGIAKSGTTSVAGIFSNYRAGHEFMFPETTKAISDYRTGVISKKEFIGFLRDRDQKGNLEMDSASFNFMYIDILAEMYPDAKFIATIRDCYSWLDSALNMFLVLDIPDWMIDYGSRSFGVHITREMFGSRQDLLRALPGILDGILGYWAYGMQFILDNLPEERSLVIKTEEISNSLDKTASFLGIPESTLVREKSHLFKATKKFNILHDMDLNLLKEKFEEHCGPLMERYFPDRSLEAFLEKAEEERLMKEAAPSLPKERMSWGSDQIANLLFELINELNIDYKFEPSVKIMREKLLGNRFILGLYKSHIEQDPHGKLLDICRRMDMREDLLEAFSENLPDAEGIGFGFEENEGIRLYKVYLDFLPKWKKKVEMNPGKSDPFLLFLAFKWNALDNRKGGSGKYMWYPDLSFDEMEGKISHIYQSDESKPLVDIIRGFLEIASTRVPAHTVRYLDATEENTPRKSFDINMYDANLWLKELYPLLQKIYRYYSIPEKEFHAVYNQIRTKTFGHLSGGIGRDGKDFLTIYCGLEDVLAVRAE